VYVLLGYILSCASFIPVPSNFFQREQDRLDFQDAILKALTNTINHPMLEHPGRILDIGTGTGVWAEAVGRRS
jgi:ubiquinone/menaquinone biosynthesis C-methylase UbiE